VATDKKPRRHHHLSRESIARAALDLVDSEGADSLTLRRVAESLGVGVMSLYTYVDDKEALIRDIVALLLAEVEIFEGAGRPWEECIVSGARSLREMAVRHPHAFPFVAFADYGQWPLSNHADRVDRALLRQGVPEDLLPLLASMLDAFSTGFLMLETKALTRSVSAAKSPFDDEPNAPAPMYAMTHPETAYEQGITLIIAGLKATRTAADAAPAAPEED
jgi:AcrR family transcriptional regulator